MQSTEKEKLLLCPMCNYGQAKLVPLYDDDQEHKKQMCCQKCKRAIRKGQEIIKLDRSKLQG
jgi:uncharacterized protein YbaR (Trm112 family)